MKKSYLIAGLLVTALAAGTIIVQSANKASAANETNGNDHDTIVEKLVQKFGLKSEDVQSVFDEVHTERQATRTAELSTSLDKAVADGVITSAQKTLLMEKHASMAGQGRGERGAMEQWAEDNGIDMSKLRDYGFGGKGMGQRGSHK